MLSGLIIAFLPRSKHLFISWLQSPFGVILELKKVKSTTVSAFPSSVRHAVMGPDAMVLGYQKMSFKSAFSLSFFTLIKFLFTFCHKGNVIYISEVVDTSPSNLFSSL